MGYSEVYCHICGVTFNFSRFRTDKEPRQAAWQNTADGVRPFGNFSLNDDLAKGRHCSRGSGCVFVQRGAVPEPRNCGYTLAKTEPEPDNECIAAAQLSSEEDGPGSNIKWLKEVHLKSTLQESASDDDYVPPEVPPEQSLSGSEYDWDSAPETEPESSGEVDKDELDSASESEADSDILYSEFKSGIDRTPPTEGTFSEHIEFDPADEECPDTVFLLSTEPTSELEHIAGPRCELTKAYNGNNISSEAMRGCCTFQCLLHKSYEEPWTPMSDDEEFETSGAWFLTGLSDHMPSTDMDFPRMFPIRHGCEMPSATNINFNIGDTTEGMPFHTTCLEIFKRASLFHSGKIDMQGLALWWAVTARNDDFWEFPQDPAVHDGKRQMWEHNPGDEFLAANPCFVPGFESLLASVRYPESADYRDRELAVSALHIDTSSRDPFECLPNELRTIVMLNLRCEDIPNLRLASRAFRQIPQSVIYALTLRDAPWLYEAWSSLPVSFWATKTAAELKKEEEILEEKQAELRRVILVLREDSRLGDEPGYYDVLIESLEQSAAELRRDSISPRPTTSVPFLIPGETDWYRLRTEINRNFDKLPGLRNRRRIWTGCEMILERIEEYRAGGEFKDV